MPTLREKSLLKSNLEFWLNNELLKDGFYTTINNGDVNSYGENLSILQADEDESYPSLTVWQSAFKEWVYESGIAPTQNIAPPIIASGVYVNGTFYPRHSYMPGYNASFAHNIDYRNGRIIFASPRSSSDIVSATFSYKTVSIEFMDAFENENNPLLIETGYKDNPYQSGILNFPSRDSRVLPLIVIDIGDRTSTGYELGWKSLTYDFKGSFNIWSRDAHIKDMLEDLLASKERDVILATNFNSAPFPLDYMGDKNLAYTSYASYASMWNNFFWHRIYLEDISVRREIPSYNVERSRVDFTAKIYTNH